MKRTTLTIALVAALTSTTAAAENTWQEESMDAWIDGKAEATLLFSGNLNSFNIDTDVNNGEVLLTGKVSSEIEKELASELISGIDGVSGVDNRLSIVNEEMSEDDTSMFVDAKISTVVKSRLLFDSEVAGSNIDVDVEDGVVTLDGMVSSDAARQLALTIASNTNDVASVNDNLKIEKQGE